MKMRESEYRWAWRSRNTVKVWSCPSRLNRQSEAVPKVYRGRRKKTRAVRLNVWGALGERAATPMLGECLLGGSQDLIGALPYRPTFFKGSEPERLGFGV